MKFLLAATLLSVSALASAQTCGLQDGRDYQKLTVDATSSVAQKLKKDSVIEFFSYACVHCATFAPMLHNLEKTSPAVGQSIVYVPVSFRPDWEVAAKLYYSLDALKMTTFENNQKIFDAAHKQNRKIFTNDKELSDFLDKTFPEKSAQIKDGMKSFDVANKITQSKTLMNKYQVDSTPMVVVDKISGGQYRLDASISQGYDRMLKSIDTLAKCK